MLLFCIFVPQDKSCVVLGMAFAEPEKCWRISMEQMTVKSFCSYYLLRHIAPKVILRFNMVKKIVQNLLVICSVWMLTGCFDVVEEVDLNSDGSGKIKATVNLSKSKTKVASLMKLDKVDGIKIPSKTEIQKEADAIVRLLKQTSGISDVQSS